MARCGTHLSAAPIPDTAAVPLLDRRQVADRCDSLASAQTYMALDNNRLPLYHHLKTDKADEAPQGGCAAAAGAAAAR